MPTVWVEPTQWDHVLAIRWQLNEQVEDVKTAFGEVLAHLDAAEEPQTIAVYMMGSPSVPTPTMVQLTLPISQHPNMTEWLVLGAGERSHIIATTLKLLTGRDNVRWFDNEVQLARYLSRAAEERANRQSNR